MGCCESNFHALSPTQLQQNDKVKSKKKEVILEAQKRIGTVHFATLMDISHLKNVELEPKHEKIQRTSRAPRIGNARRSRDSGFEHTFKIFSYLTFSLCATQTNMVKK